MVGIALWLLASVALVLAVPVVLSFFLTRRQRQQEFRSPAEYGLPFEEVAFPASDGVMLRGWYIPSPGSTRAVVIMHGHGGSMDCDVHRAPPFHAAGYNVLLFDFRAHGRSEGRMVTFGYLERRDVQGAVAFLHQRGVRQIGLLGFSLGGIVGMLAAPVCPGVTAVVSDGGPARMRSALTMWGVERGLPQSLSAVMAWLAIFGASLRLGANLFHYEPVRWVGRIAPRPILFIHGDHDQYLPDFDELYAAAREPKELWRLAEAGHTTASQMFPEEHTRRVLAFFEHRLTDS